MSIFRFNKEDIIRNTIVANPKQKFLIYNSAVYQSENFPSSSIPAYGILTKNGTLASYKTISSTSYASDFTYGDEITGSNFSFFTSSLSRYYYEQGSSDRTRINTLKNIVNYYKMWSPHYAFSSSLGDKGTQEINIINIPSIYYGSKIKKGSVELNYYFTGTLAATLKDVNDNGELIQVGPVGSNGSGSVAGVCLYNEGLLILTGSWDVTEPDDFGAYGVENGKWVNFGVGIEPDFPLSTCLSSSFEINLEGYAKVPSTTIFCNAPKGLLNYSNNYTFVDSGSNFPSSYSDKVYLESKKRVIKNITKSSYNDESVFEKTTYISKIHIYDKDKNLLGVAKLAKPVKKTEDRDFTFKIKVDL